MVCWNFLFYYFYCQSLGQTTDPTSYTCNENNFNIRISRSTSPHSAFDNSSNCSLSQCTNNNNSCLSSNAHCFGYRSINNQSYCAPGSLCSILEPCDNITGQCATNTSVCIVNSCCLPKTKCLPLSLINLCSSASKCYGIKNIRIIQVNL